MRLGRLLEADCVGGFARLLRRLRFVFTRRSSEARALLLRRPLALRLEGGAILATAAAPASPALAGRSLLACCARVFLRRADGSVFGGAGRQPSIEMRMFDFSRPELRVWANSDSEMQRFESSRLSQAVRL